MHILIIEDDARTAAYLVKGLSESGHTVDRAADGKDGLFMAMENEFDLLIVDRMLPALDGLSVIRTLRAARREVPLPVREASRIDTIEQWDERVIAPRHGFAGAEDYWAQTSACNVLGDINTPTLFVAAERDPMVGIDTLRPWLQNATRLRRIVTREGGHVGFPQKVDLGLGTGGTVEDQLIQWMLAPT